MGVFDATLQGDCGCNRVAPEYSPPVNTSWLDARQLDYATRGGGPRPQFGGEPGSANVIVPSVQLNLVPPYGVGSLTQVPSAACLAAIQPLVCLWAPAVRRMNAAQFQLHWISRIISTSSGNNYRTLLHIAEFGDSLDSTLSAIRPLDPRSWATEMPELYGTGPGVLGPFWISRRICRTLSSSFRISTDAGIHTSQPRRNFGRHQTTVLRSTSGFTLSLVFLIVLSFNSTSNATTMIW